MNAKIAAAKIMTILTYLQHNVHYYSSFKPRDTIVYNVVAYPMPKPPTSHEKRLNRPASSYIV